jgi:2-methylcitrate dehydratase PrpD
MEQGKEHGIKFRLDSTEGIDHQLANTECGIYCLYFIIELLTGKKTSEYFKKHMIRDDSMEKLRKVYFNPSS